MSARQSAAMDKALLYLADGCTVAEAARLAGVSKTAVYRAMVRLGIDKPGWKRKNTDSLPLAASPPRR